MAKTQFTGGSIHYHNIWYIQKKHVHDKWTVYNRFARENKYVFEKEKSTN